MRELLHDMWADPREFAIKWHGDQMYGDQPYVAHLDMVVKLLEDAGHQKGSDVWKAGYLHDVLEDTDCKYPDILNAFGSRVLTLVALVTDPPGKSRKERKAQLYIDMCHDHEAVAIKLADRAANVGNCLKTKSPLLQMYLDEHPAFEKGLRFGENLRMNTYLWDYLDVLIDVA